jgi:hypothetical protein
MRVSFPPPPQVYNGCSLQLRVTRSAATYALDWICACPARYFYQGGTEHLSIMDNGLGSFRVLERCKPIS